ncbi:MAG: hypothetical protein K0Q51_1581 [Rickettsiaceae bacterium]|jgi:hypothetical protein|nr:hypothetical protein [Rickettsiaceae bacterium]
MSKGKILDIINGDNGIISLMGQANTRERIDKGPLTAKHETQEKAIASLNALATVFHKGSYIVPYTAIVEVTGQDKVYLSCPGEIPKLGWKEVDKIAILQALKNLVNKDDNDNKIELFKKLCIGGNSIIYEIVSKTLEKEQKYMYREEKNHYNLFQSLRNGKIPDFKFNKNDKSYFEEFAVKTINQIVDIDKLKYANIANKEIKITPYLGKTDQCYGVHVEVKGLYYAKKDFTNEKDFNIGLATIKDAPGCCAGCSAELIALERREKHNLKRIGDYYNNFPPKKYKASPNIDKMETVNEFANIIVNRCKRASLQLKIKDEKLHNTLSILEKLVKADGVVSSESMNSSNLGSKKNNVMSDNTLEKEIADIQYSESNGNTSNYTDSLNDKGLNMPFLGDMDSMS